MTEPERLKKAIDKSLSERDQMRETNKQLSIEVASLRKQVRILAKLASEKPAFNNPIHVYEAKALRDKIIINEKRCGTLHNE